MRPRPKSRSPLPRRFHPIDANCPTGCAMRTWLLQNCPPRQKLRQHSVQVKTLSNSSFCVHTPCMHLVCPRHADANVAPVNPLSGKKPPPPHRVETVQKSRTKTSPRTHSANSIQSPFPMLDESTAFLRVAPLEYCHDSPSIQPLRATTQPMRCVLLHHHQQSMQGVFCYKND